MRLVADQGGSAARPRLTMRPRRWYVGEIAPPRRGMRLTARLWRYRSFVRRRKSDAVLYHRAASFYNWMCNAESGS
jgi:hypothetical protein